MISSVEEYMKLLESDSPDERHKAAWLDMPADFWFEVLAKYPELSFAVAHNKKIPYEVLKHLAIHSDDRVRSMVAKKNKLKEDILFQLPKDAYDHVRMSVARHKNSTEL